MGSSGAAIVAGAVLANEACKLNLSNQQLLEYCLLIENHPDNISASLFGGFVASYLRSTSTSITKDLLSSSDDDKYIHEKGLESQGLHEMHKVYPNVPSIGLPVRNASVHVQLPWNPAVKLILIIPNFELQTKLSRSVLPTSYSRADVIFNLQRIAVLTNSLGPSTTPDAHVIYEAMHDKIHQSYRAHLVPGLPQILSLNPTDTPGLLGICMSGAGPTVLVLAVDHFDVIGQKIVGIFNQQKYSSHENGGGGSIDARYEVLEVSHEGVQVSYNYCWN